MEIHAAGLTARLVLHADAAETDGMPAEMIVGMNDGTIAEMIVGTTAETIGETIEEMTVGIIGETGDHKERKNLPHQ